MTLATATALQVNDKNKTKHETETKPTPPSPSSRGLEFLLQLFPKAKALATAELGVFTTELGAEPGPRSKMAVPSAHRHHPPSPDCVLCNRLACSIRILQLIAWAVSSGQLCLKKSRKSLPWNHTVPKILSAATPRQSSMSQQLNLQNKTKMDSKTYFPGSFQGTVFWGSTWWGCPVVCLLHKGAPANSLPFLLHQLASSLWQEPATRNNGQ